MAIGLLLGRNFLSGLRTLKSKNLENLKPEKKIFLKTKT